MPHTRPVQLGAAMPGTCLPGELFFNSAAPSGENLYGCVALNTWASLGGPGLGGCTVSGGDSLSCPGEFASGDGSTAGELALFETSANGTEHVSWLAPDSMASSYRLRMPDSAPQPGQVISFTAPAGGIAQGSWITPGGAGVPTAYSHEWDEWLPGGNSDNSAPGKLGWISAGLVSYAAAGADLSTPGWAELTASGVNTAATMHLGGYNLNYRPLANLATTTNWEFQFVIKADNYFTSQTIWRAGLADSVGQNPANGIWIRMNNNTACTNTGLDTGFTYEAKSSGNSTTWPSGVAAATGSKFRIRIRSVETGHVLFSISANGGAWSSEADISTNLPNGALAPVLQLFSCDGSAHKMYVDRYDQITPRSY